MLSVEQMVSDFFCATCLVNTKFNRHKMNASLWSAGVAIFGPKNGDYTYIATPAGSSVDFYVETMFPCVNDYDIMYYRNDDIAVPQGYPVPRSLPAEFHCQVKVFELINTNFPGYVLAKYVSNLVKRENDDNYENCLDPESCGVYLSITEVYASHFYNINQIRHGPALQLSFPAYLNIEIPYDGVLCLRCLTWPPQAADWPKRRRKHGWPDSKTIDRIVNNGCDVVQVAHPTCRLDEMTRDCLWRLSFSRAETILLNSWSVKQQIVYHILRIFMKSVRPEDGDTSGFVDNYVIKTLMLWTCECYSPTFWNNDNVITVCMRIIRRLANCVTLFKCLSYFIRSGNLFDGRSKSSDKLKSFGAYLNNLTGEQLCWRLIDKYIRQHAEQPHCLFPDLEAFPDTRDASLLSPALSTLAERRQDVINFHEWKDIQWACGKIEELIFNISFPPNKEICKHLTELLNAFESRWFHNYFSAICFLKIATMLEREQSVLQVADTMLTLVQSGMLVFSHDDSALVSRLCDGCSNSIPTAPRTVQSSDVCKYFETACALMRTVRVTCDKTTSLSRLLIELSKIYLHSSLNCTDEECGNFHVASHCILNVYLACLYFSNKQSKLGVDRCQSAITYSRELSGRPTLHHVHREQLPCFEESVETKMGVILLYSYLVKRFVGHGCEDLCARVDIYSGDLFAYYLISLYFNVYVAKKFEKSARETCKAYKKCFINKRQLTVADVLLFHGFCHGNQLGDQRNEQVDSISHTCVRRAVRMKSFKFNTTRLYRLLLQSAVEYLTAFRVSTPNFFGFDHILTNDFHAMYAYRFHLNEECFQICETNVHRLFNDARAITVFCTPMSSVKCSDLIHLMDDDCMSLIGLANLCDTCKLYSLVRERLQRQTLLVYLLIQSKLRLKHSAATFMEMLGDVLPEWLSVIPAGHHTDINKAMLIFIYRKAIRRLSSLNIQLDV